MQRAVVNNSRRSGPVVQFFLFHGRGTECRVVCQAIETVLLLAVCGPSWLSYLFWYARWIIVLCSDVRLTCSSRYMHTVQQVPREVTSSVITAGVIAVGWNPTPSAICFWRTLTNVSEHGRVRRTPYAPHCITIGHGIL